MAEITPAKAVAYLVSKGLSPTQAAGMVGSLMQESSLRTGAFNPKDPGGSIGLGQWNGSRRTGFENFLRNSGRSLDDPTAHLDYILQEGQGPEKGAWGKLQSSQDIPSAVDASLAFERPSNPARDNRLRYANEALMAFAPNTNVPTQKTDMPQSAVLAGMGAGPPVASTMPGLLESLKTGNKAGILNGAKGIGAGISAMAPEAPPMQPMAPVQNTGPSSIPGANAGEDTSGGESDLAKLLKMLGIGG